MKVLPSGKPTRTSVGLGFIAIALLAAVGFLPDAKKAPEPILYVCVVGGLFVVVPAVLGIGVVLENRRKRH